MSVIRSIRFLVFLALLTGANANADWLWTRTIVSGVGAIRTATYGGGTFVVGTSNGYLLSSRDGVTWTTARPATQAIEDVTFGNGRFVACIASSNGVKSKLVYSADGVSWNFARRVTNNGRFSSNASLTAISSKGGRFISMGPSAPAFAASVNGTRWQDPLDGRKPSGYAGSISGLTASGAYVLCSTLAGATIQTSSDGLAWTTRFMTAPRGPARGIAGEKPGRHVICVGENGLVLVSSDAAQRWESHPFGSTDLLGVSAANKLFVSVADKAVYSTPAGLAWTRQLRLARSGDHLRAITGGLGLYIAVGSNAKNGLIMASAGQPGPSAPQ